MRKIKIQVIKSMKKINFNSYLLYLTIAFLFIVCEARGQEPVAKNGKFVTVRGMKMYYEESGKGMALILLHNFGGTASQWKPFIPEFSKYYRVIAVDMPGHGMDTTDVYLHKKAAEYIIGLLDTLKIDSVYVIGASSGGFVTSYMATLRPELTKKIIVIGGQVYYSLQTRKFFSSLGPGTEDHERLEAAIKAHGKEKGTLIQKQFWRFRNLYGDPSFTPDILATITAKTLIIHGDNDEIAPVSNALEMYKSIPKAHLWIVPYGGHLPHLDQLNQSDFVRRTLEFMNSDWDK
jgi:pimeloyl-ACP methyl ester carboxylesterase